MVFSLIADNPSSEILSIQKVDLCIDRNGYDHHTDRFDLMKRSQIPKLVVRRGQPFKIQLHCNRPYSHERDALSLILAVADIDKPTFGHGTLIGLSLSRNSTQLGEPNEWSAAINAINGDILEIIIKPAAIALIASPSKIAASLKAGINSIT